MKERERERRGYSNKGGDDRGYRGDDQSVSGWNTFEAGKLF